MGNTFGQSLRLTTFGESHGPGIGLILDGCPSRIPIVESEIQAELDRRRPGTSDLTTPRKEGDRAQILSGVFDGVTTGTPIHIYVANRDHRSGDYDQLKDVYRPSHADFTYQTKYGVRDHRGGGRSSARETISRVAAGVIARKILATAAETEILAYVTQVHRVVANIDPGSVTLKAIESNPIRCPDPEAASRMIEVIGAARDRKDSVGGVIEVQARGVPVGLGEPVFGKLDAELGRALLSIPATKGVEIGSGFGAVEMFGSEHNDSFRSGTGKKGIHTSTNRSGGIQGGISNGETIVARIAFKPTSTIGKEQGTVNKDGSEVQLAASGRHDPCVLPRAVPIVEAMVALTLADHLLLDRARKY